MEKYGYDKFADLVGRCPEYAICRKFGSLSAKKILYQQAELSKLERELQILSEYDQANDPNRAFATSWFELENAPAVDNANLQTVKARHVFKKLDEYHDNILRTLHVLSLSSPRKSELGFLQDWLDSEHGGNCFLRGIEREPYEDKHARDLVTLSPAAGKDPFAHFLTDKIVPWYHRCLGHKRKIAVDVALGPLWEYKYRFFEVVADTMCAILSSVIPVASIFLLYYVQSMFKKLIIATAMNFLFSFIVAAVVRGRRVDVFAASTAFAAIQVVFIGGVNIISKKQ